MRIVPASPAGLFVIEAEKREDERGCFARTFCAQEFAAAGLPVSYPQCNVSFNARRGTLRGMHYQADPYPEPKLVRCTRGSAFDVAIDLRAGSATRGRWFGVVLSADTATALFIPAGFAHGFQTLEDRTEIFYQMGESYVPGLARGVRWNDPAFGVDWPIADPILSSRDMSWPFVAMDFAEA
jgi:dTDP-4-dehydrorhamnose 3,5-epimerase